MKKSLFLLVSLMLMLGFSNPLMAADTADVIFVVDESGSMYNEHAWLGNMVNDLESGLAAANVTNNRYGLVGFGGSNSSGHLYGHQHDLDAGTSGVQEWGTSGELASATSGLVLNGGTEDGWQAINFALNNYAFRSGAAVNIVLITDEDRDNLNNSLSYANMLATLKGKGAILNAVINANLKDGGNNAVLGVSDDQVDENNNHLGDSFLADGSGGYTYSDGGYYYSGAGTSEADYFDLALATGGAAWDLNKLRAGGNTATSFTKAFVDIKVKEIEDAPEPAFMFLFGSGILGIAAVRRKMK